MRAMHLKSDFSGPQLNDSIFRAIENYDHVIWDWNGTLVDDVDLAVAAVNVLLLEHGLATVTATSYREIFGFPVRTYYEKLGFDFNRATFEQLCDRFAHEYNSKRSREARLFDGVNELLMRIRKTKTQSILSAAAQWHLDEVTEHFQIQHHFHHRYGIDNHYAASKVQRGRELVEKSGISPQRTILIGDTDHDFEVAQDLGIECLLIADGHQSAERLQKFSSAKVISGRRSY